MSGASALPGRWALTMRTPIGRIEAELTFVDDGDGIGGTATGRAETVPLRDVRTDPAPEGEHVTWDQSITKPIRLDLRFDVVVTGDVMTGTSRAGRLPRSAVTGRRIER
ncbi:hypothetical protein [Amnibacterium setariae]|uniref:Uncharacterized protein n=1 Tax=Amnibacterium setariae TaxID=2306585 RepID=A0A3A1TZ54_9MICO|nr:hypothetical protein [Amnibacterium setariae]RIX29995.1 hypothetical protein D1781_00510 [Amnibacterium setariae]